MRSDGKSRNSSPRPRSADMVEDWLKRAGIVLQPVSHAHLRALIQRNHPLAQIIILVSKASQSFDAEEKARLYKQSDAVGLYEEEAFEVLCLLQLKAEDVKKWRSQMHETIRKNAQDLLAKCPPVSMGMLADYMAWMVITLFRSTEEQS